MRKRFLIGFTALALTIGFGVAGPALPGFGGGVQTSCASSASDYCAGGG